MALYRYVSNKAGLNDLMIDEVYASFTVPPGEGWRGALQGLGLSGWAALQQHPWAARLAYSRSPIGPNALKFYEAALTELAPLHLDAATRMGFIDTVLGHVYGSGLALLGERAMRTRTKLDTDADLDQAIRPHLARISDEGQHPQFSAWARDPGRHEPAPQPSSKSWNGYSTVSKPSPRVPKPMHADRSPYARWGRQRALQKHRHEALTVTVGGATRRDSAHRNSAPKPIYTETLWAPFSA